MRGRTIRAGARASGRAWIAIAIVEVALAANVAGGVSPAAAAVVNRIIATVDGEPITSYQLESFINLHARGVDPATVSEGDRSRALEVLITELLIQAESNAVGVRVGKEEIDRYIDQIKQKNNLDDAGLATALGAQGLTLEAYRDQVKREIEKSQLIARQIRARVNITPEEVERYYEAHRDEYARPEGMHVRHVFFRLAADAPPEEVEATMARAKQAHDRLKKGEDFEKLAREVSQGPEAGKGGDLGVIGKGQMLPELEQALSGMKEKQVSAPVRTQVGVHILRLDQKLGASDDGLDQAKEQIKEKLYAEAVESRFQRWLVEDLKKSHAVVIR